MFAFRVRFSLIKLLFPVLAIILASCGDGIPSNGAGTGGRPTSIAILVDDTVNPMRNYQVVLLEKLIRMRPHMEVLYAQAAGDAAAQARQVSAAVEKNSAVLMIFPVDPAAISPSLREAVQQGVKVIAFSRDVPADACTTAVFVDEREIGRMAGRHALSALEAKARAENLPASVGRIVLLRGPEGSPACEQRAAALLETLQQAPGAVLVHDAPTDWNEGTAAARIKEALRIQKQFDIIVAQNDIVAAAASCAVREADPAARDRMLIMGTDGAPGSGAGLEMVLKGELEATVWHPPLVDVAWGEVQRLLDDPARTPSAPIKETPAMITPGNAAEVKLRGRPVSKPE